MEEHNIKSSHKIFVAGHNGMVGSAIIRKLLNLNYKQENIITADRNELDLTNQLDVFNFLKENKPNEIYLAAAKVGGIHSNNTYPADFIYQNLMVQCNLIHGSYLSGIKKLLFLGSSCIYPRLAKQPMSENELLSGPLELTNEPYAVSKIAGIKMCESYNRQYGKTHNLDYRSVMPTNLYGPGDSYNSINSHIIPALISRFHMAKLENLNEVEVWGTGSAYREFLYVDDMAEASIFVMNLKKEAYKQKIQPRQTHINIGSGSDIKVQDLAELIKEVVGFNGKIINDKSKPDGPPRKLLDSSLINNIGWEPRISLKDGLKLAYVAFLRDNNGK